MTKDNEMAGHTSHGLTSVNKAITEEATLLKHGFVIADVLGEGSYATVWEGIYNKTKTKCAIKVINRNKAPQDFLKKFMPREIKILKSVHHPNIIGLLDVVEIGHKIYIAMQLAGHGDMLEYIKLRGALKESKAREFFVQLAEGIRYMHGRHFIHRDLKCENLLLDGKNMLKISDFGFAREILPSDMSRTFCGSAAYAAPEILLGKPYIGTCYDIWSMGVILYIMVCGSMPYDDSNIKRMVRDQTEKKLGFSRNKDISFECKDLIITMLNPNPKKRANISEIFGHPWMRGEVNIVPQVERVPTHAPGTSHNARKSNHQKKTAEEKPKSPAGAADDEDQRQETKITGYNEPKRSFHLPDNHTGV